MSTTTTYTIERVTEEWLVEDKKNLDDFSSYVRCVGPELTKLFEDKLKWEDADFPRLVKRGIFLLCFRNGIPTGHMICSIFPSLLDRKVKILHQISFHAKPDSGRTAYHLFQKFIDIGRKDANHIITMLTSQTNIKPKTLENMGFKEIETLYRLEIK